MDNAVTLLYAAPTRPAPTSGMSDMITASARHSWTCRQRNGTKPKFFNDFSRAHARAREGTAIRSLSRVRPWAERFALIIWPILIGVSVWFFASYSRTRHDRCE
jgi:hypothetical protein